MEVLIVVQEIQEELLLEDLVEVVKVQDLEHQQQLELQTLVVVAVEVEKIVLLQVVVNKAVLV